MFFTAVLQPGQHRGCVYEAAGSGVQAFIPAAHGCSVTVLFLILISIHGKALQVGYHVILVLIIVRRYRARLVTLPLKVSVVPVTILVPALRCQGLAVPLGALSGEHKHLQQCPAGDGDDVLIWSLWPPALFPQEGSHHYPSPGRDSSNSRITFSIHLRGKGATCSLSPHFVSLPQKVFLI